MGSNIILILQQIFFGKEDPAQRVGISEFKKKPSQIKYKKIFKKKVEPQELKLSELMRKGSC